MTLSEEERLIHGIVSGNTTIIQRVYQLYAPRVSNYILKTGGTLEDAQDVFQDAIMIVYDKAQVADFKLTVQFYTYLFAICKQLWWRKKKKKSYSEITTDDFEGYNLIEESFEATIISNEKHHLYQQCLQQISAICRKILALASNQIPMADIAKEMGFKSEGYARIRKLRCKNKLVEIIKSDSRFREFYGKE